MPIRLVQTLFDATTALHKNEGIHNTLLLFQLLFYFSSKDFGELNGRSQPEPDIAVAYLFTAAIDYATRSGFAAPITAVDNIHYIF